MLKKQAEANIPTDFGDFKIIAFSESRQDWMPHLALVSAGTDFNDVVNIRIHSECATGDIFHSKKCECGQQLSTSMNFVHENGGVILYLRQEGRNIGIINKIKAYALQEKGLNTVEANLELGLPADGRDFEIALEILRILGIKKINLLTNNPEKVKFIEESDIILNKRIPLKIESNQFNKSYLEVKKSYFGHFLDEE